LNLIVLISVHETESGFRGCNFGANEHGIFLATGPDRMHLMLEGLGKHIVVYCIQTIAAAGSLLHYLILCFSNNSWLYKTITGTLQAADDYIASMPLTLHQGATKTIPFLIKVTGGLQSVNTVSALQLPGLLVVLSLAMVCHLHLCSDLQFYVMLQI
jgi:hypothetical protein